MLMVLGCVVLCKLSSTSGGEEGRRGGGGAVRDPQYINGLDTTDCFFNPLAFRQDWVLNSKKFLLNPNRPFPNYL